MAGEVNEEVITEEKKPEVNVDDIVAKKLAEKEKEIEAKYSKKYKADMLKLEEDLVKQMEDTAIESSAENTNTVDEKKVQDNVEVFAEKIKIKREKERLEREKIERENEYLATQEELKKYKLREQLDKIKQEEPYLADVIDDAVNDGTLNSIEQLNVVFNDSLRTRLKTAYMYENAIKQAGGDPRTYLDNKGAGIDQAAKNEMRKQKLAEKKAKYRRNY